MFWKEATVCRVVSVQAARYTDYVIAGAVTLVVHVLAFVTLVALAVLEIIAAPSRVVAMAPPPEVMVEIRLAFEGGQQPRGVLFRDQEVDFVRKTFSVEFNDDFCHGSKF